MLSVVAVIWLICRSVTGQDIGFRAAAYAATNIVSAQSVICYDCSARSSYVLINKRLSFVLSQRETRKRTALGNQHTAAVIDTKNTLNMADILLLRGTGGRSATQMRKCDQTYRSRSEHWPGFSVGVRVSSSVQQNIAVRRTNRNDISASHPTRVEVYAVAVIIRFVPTRSKT